VPYCHEHRRGQASAIGQRDKAQRKRARRCRTGKRRLEKPRMLPRLRFATRLILGTWCGEPPATGGINGRPSAMLLSGCRINCDLIALKMSCGWASAGAPRGAEHQP
jgi:hypothetical protein